MNSINTEQCLGRNLLPHMACAWIPGGEVKAWRCSCTQACAVSAFMLNLLKYHMHVLPCNSLLLSFVTNLNTFLKSYLDNSKIPAGLC